MADVINFTLPTFKNSTTDEDIKQIKSYLYTLTEQMKFYLNNIDADNYNEEYQKKMAALIDSSRSNSIKANIVQDTMRKMKKEYDNAINEAVGKISGNLGGYIVTLDLNDDGCPDDLRILVDTYDYKTATKYWQFNRAGLAFIQKEGDALTSNLALTADGFIAADRIKGVIGDFVTLNACTLNACVGSFSGSVTATEGYIGNWKILEDCIFSRIPDKNDSCYEVKIKNDKSKDAGKKAFYVNYFTGGYNSDTLPKNLESQYKEEKFFVKRSGYMYSQFGKIGDFDFYPVDNQGHGGLCSDYGNWRVYIQSAYDSETINRNEIYAFSTQYKYDTLKYRVTFGVTMDGNVITDKNYYVNDVNRGLRYGTPDSNYGLVYCTDKGNIILGDFNAAADVNIYSPNRIFLCLGEYGEHIYIQRSDWSVDGNTIGNFITLYSNRGLWFSVNNGNSEFAINTLRFRLVAKNITTSGNLYYAPGGLLVTSSSAARLKENITDKIDSDIDPMKLLDACVKQFNYKPEYKDNVIFAGKQIGFIADELEKVYPLACLYNSKGEVDNWNDRIVISALFYIVKKMYNELKEIKNEN